MRPEAATLFRRHRNPTRYFGRRSYTTDFADPFSYDLYRFTRLLAGQSQDPINYASEELYQTRENIGLGYGRHTCPGRFFAADEIKTICTRMPLDYDIKMPDGIKGRYPNVVRGSSITPDRTKTILVRKVAAQFPQAALEPGTLRSTSMIHDAILWWKAESGMRAKTQQEALESVVRSLGSPAKRRRHIAIYLAVNRLTPFSFFV